MPASALAVFKLVLALAAGALAAHSLIAPRRFRHEKLLFATLGVLAVIAFVPLSSPSRGLVHRWEMFHYYLGSFDGWWHSDGAGLEAACGSLDGAVIEDGAHSDGAGTFDGSS